MTHRATKASPFRKTKIGKTWHHAKQKTFRLRKEIYQRCCCSRSNPTRVLLIVGCQRSGTTLMGNVFAKDLRTAVLQEQSVLTCGKGLRLKPYSEVNDLLAAFRSPLIVVKPLVESQWTPEMLREISGSKALWMFRDYHDVVSSNIARFRSQVEGLRIALSETQSSWRNERLSDDTRAIMKRYHREDISKTDAAALGWYRRNVLFFELGLEQHADVLLCRYESFVNDPDETMSQIYRHLSLDYPKQSITGDIDRQSLGLGQDIAIDEGIDELCSQLMRRLEGCYDEQRGS